MEYGLDNLYKALKIYLENSKTFFEQNKRIEEAIVVLNRSLAIQIERDKKIDEENEKMQAEFDETTSKEGLLDEEED